RQRPVGADLNRARPRPGNARGLSYALPDRAMKAVGVFPAKQEVRLVEHDEPKISAPADVKLRMLAVGVCGTDREICAFEYGTPPPGSDHFILGHESLGEVVEIGPAVTRVKPGDLVVATVRRPCGHESCAACR